MTKRSAGITLTAIAAFLGSGLLLVFAAVMAATMISSSAPPVPPDAEKFVRAALVGLVFVLVVAGVWGIATAVGLLRLRPWSRLSAMVFSFLLLFLGASAAVMIAISPAAAGPDLAGKLASYVKGGIEGLYGVLALLGGFWLYYFNKPSVRDQFDRDPSLALSNNRRPLSITIVAALLLLSAVTSVLFIVVPFPAYLFGFLIVGWAARVIYAATAAASLLLGLGLLRMVPVSRVLTIAFLTYSIVSSLLYVAMPGYAERQRALLDMMPSSLQAPGSHASAPSRIVFLVGLPIYLVQIWLLVARKKSFEQPAATQSSL